MANLVKAHDSALAANTESAIGQAFVDWKDPNSAWVPFQSGGAKLFTGGIGGEGNFTADRYGNSINKQNNTHPNITNHLHINHFITNTRHTITL